MTQAGEHHLQMRGHCTTILLTAIAPTLMVYATWLTCTLPLHSHNANFILIEVSYL
jgi:hypothetical protein